MLFPDVPVSILQMRQQRLAWELLLALVYRRAQTLGCGLYGVLVLPIGHPFHFKGLSLGLSHP